MIARCPQEFEVQVLAPDGRASGLLTCTLDRLSQEERRILLAGSLINYYRSGIQNP